jgi:beta-glucosidase
MRDFTWFTYLIFRTSEELPQQIPLLFGIDAVHGHALWPGATVFPTQLSMSCSWNPELIRRAARVTAKEMRATGVHWTFSPLLDVARDIRWVRHTA